MSKFSEFRSELEITELSDFEREYLIPAAIERIRYFKECFEKLIPICNDIDNAVLIDGAVRVVVSDPGIDKSVPTPKVGVQYLQGIRQQIETFWLKELGKFLNDFPNPEVIRNQKEMLRFTQRAQFLSSSIVSAKTTLLRFSLRAFPTIINRGTGQQEYGIPKEIEIVAYPFQGALSEMESSASTLIESFQNWRATKMETRRDFASFLIAKEQLESAKSLNRFQILVIAFTIILTLSANELIRFFVEATPVIRGWFR